MKFVVAGQSDAGGVIGNDSSDLNVYYELGWEVTFTNIMVKTLLKEGKLSSSDTIVTHKDRAFFYSSLFDRVIDWEEFKKLELGPIDEVFFLPKNIESWPELEVRLNREFVCNFDLLTDIENRFGIDEPFGIYCIRLRDHCSWRNSDLEVAKRVISKLSDQFNYKIFLTGRNTETIAEELNVKSVSLREYASLVNSELCKFCISPMSGIVQITNFCGHWGMHNFIFDHQNERGIELVNHPLFMGDNVNFKNVKNTFIPGKETEEKILELVSRLK